MIVRYIHLVLCISLSLIIKASLYSEEKEVSITLSEKEINYLEGYIEALIYNNYKQTKVIVKIDRNGIAYLINLPKDIRIKKSILSLVSSLDGIKEAKEVDNKRESPGPKPVIRSN